MRAHTLSFIPAALVAVLLTNSVQADQPIGQIKTLTGDVRVERDSASVSAQLGQNLYESDVIITGDNGSTGMLFSDDSRMAVGPESEFVLSSYQYDTQTGKGSAMLDIRSGALAVVAGNMIERTPESLKVRTPTAVIAVRGTEFAVKVEKPAN